MSASASTTATTTYSPTAPANLIETVSFSGHTHITYSDGTTSDSPAPDTSTTYYSGPPDRPQPPDAADDAAAQTSAPSDFDLNSILPSLAEVQQSLQKAKALLADAGAQAWDKIKTEAALLPATLEALPGEIKRTFENGEAADSLKGYVDNSTLMQVATGGQIPQGSIYGNEEAYQQGAEVVAPLVDEAAKQAILSTGFGKVAQFGCVLRSGQYGTMAMAGGQALRYGQMGMSAYGVYSAGSDAIDAYQRGDSIGFAKSSISFVARSWDFANSYLTKCFPAGTPIRTPDGSKYIEDFKPGDLILTADEHDPEATPIVGRVTHFFSNYSPLTG